MHVERRGGVIAFEIGSTGNGRNPIFNGRRQPSCGGTSRMTRECQVRICERLGVKFPGPTRPFATCQLHRAMSASLFGHLGSSTFRLSTTTVSMSRAGSCFSSESALGPFHHGIRGRGGTIFTAALPPDDGRYKRTCELTSSIVPRGTSFHGLVELRVFSYRIW